MTPPEHPRLDQSLAELRPRLEQLRQDVLGLIDQAQEHRSGWIESVLSRFEEALTQVEDGLEAYYPTMTYKEAKQRKEQRHAERRPHPAF